MKNEISFIGIFEEMHQLNPDVIRKQRMHELKDLAEYRQRHLQPILDWSDPKKRAKMKYEWEIERIDSTEKLKEIPAEKIAVREGKTIKGFVPGEFVAVVQRNTWWWRFKLWLRGLFGRGKRV